MISAVYAKNSTYARQELWLQITSIVTDKLWLLLGNFNCIRFIHEKMGGETPNLEALEDFNNCIYEAELKDLKWWGQKFTWWNK